MPDDKNNTGNLNTGYRNTGNWNTGGWNTGNRNTGNLNTGYRNTGNWNTGDWNTGNLNTGDWNTGYRNTGDLNTGDRNTGNLNTGDLNTGDRNTGNLNTGDLNTGDRNTGYLNDEDAPVTFFGAVVPGLSWEDADELIPYIDLPQFSCEWIDAKNMTEAEKESAPSYKTTGGYLRKYSLTIQQSFPLAWAKLTREEKLRWFNLPNFNAVKFLNCTGVDVRLDKDIYKQPEPLVEDEPTPETITIGGKKYRLVAMDTEPNTK